MVERPFPPQTPAEIPSVAIVAGPAHVESALGATGPGGPPIPTISSVDELHELRVRIPVNLHRQLLSLKVLRGRSLAETVSLALDNYFAEVRSNPASHPSDRDE